MSGAVGGKGSTAVAAGAGAPRPIRVFAGKGRHPAPHSLAEVRAAIGSPPPEGHRRDRLIEHLHCLQDAHGALREGHLVALAAEMRLSMAEVYEVASFYHHFDIVADDAVAGAADAAGVHGAQLPACRRAKPPRRGAFAAGLGRRAGGGRALHRPLRAGAGRARRAARGRPCRPRRAGSGTLLVGACAGSRLADRLCRLPRHRRLCARGGACPGRVPRRGGDRCAGGRWPARPRRRGLPGRAQVAHRARPAGAALPGGEHRRGRAGNVQGPHVPRARPAPLPRGRAGRGAGQSASSACGSTCATNTMRRARCCRPTRCLEADPPCPLPAIELRRGAGAYICGEESAMLESIEGKRGDAADAPALRRRGGPVRPANAGAQPRDPVLGARHRRARAGLVRRLTAAAAAAGCARSRVSGRVREPGVKLAPAGITLRELVDEYCGGMAEGHALYAYLPGGASGGILPAALADVPLDFDTLQPHGASSARRRSSSSSTATGRATRRWRLLRFFADESCGQCTPCRVGTAKAAALMAQPGVGPAAARRAGAGDGGRVDLRPRPGGAEPAALRAALLRARGRRPRMNAPTDPLVARRRRLHARRPVDRGRCRRDDPRRRARATASRSRTCATRTACAPDGNCRACVVEIDGERTLAAICCRTPGAGHGGAHRQRAGARQPQRMVLELLLADCPKPATVERRRRRAAGDSRPGPTPGRRGAAALAALRASRRRPTCRTRRWRSSSTPASSAGAACAPAARSRSTTSSATRLRGAQRRSSSTSTTRWAHRPASACGECVQACPTGALLPRRRDARHRRPSTDAGRLGVPVLRRRLPGHLPRARRAHRRRRRARRPGQPRPAVRQGPLRLRLRAPPAAADAAADPPRRRRQGPGAPARARRLARGLPRGDLGGGAGRSPPAASRAIRDTHGPTRSPASARPRAATRRPTCSRSWCAPASAPTTSTTARGCATPPASPRCSRASARARSSQPGRRRRAGRGDPGDRRQPDGQPPGRRDLDQERGRSAARR